MGYDSFIYGQLRFGDDGEVTNELITELLKLNGDNDCCWEYTDYLITGPRSGLKNLNTTDIVKSLQKYLKVIKPYCPSGINGMVAVIGEDIDDGVLIQVKQ